MNKDKQIEEMAEDICRGRTVNKKCDACRSVGGCLYRDIAAHLTAEGYRKISDDHQRQCTCYALGCQMAEELERKVAREFIEAVDSMMECLTAMTGYALTYYGSYAELKKKYTEGKENIPSYVRMDVKALPAILKVEYTEEGK